VRRREIACRIFVAPVEDAPAALLGDSLHQLAGFALGALDAQRFGANKLALRIGRAAGEFPILAMLFNQLGTALGTFFIEEFVRLEGSARAGLQAARRLAIGISGASQKHSPAAALDDHVAPAIVAGFDFRRAILALGRQFRRKVANEIAIRIPGAAQEKNRAG